MKNYLTAKIHFSCTKSSVIDEDGIVFTGYASVFNVLDRNGDIILPNAFNDSLNSAGVIKVLLEHDHTKPIGLITSLTQDEYGLLVVAKIFADNKDAEDVILMLQNGTLDSLSIGYLIDESYINNNEQKVIKKAQLLEVSVVAVPANPLAVITQLNTVNEPIIDQNELITLQNNEINDTQQQDDILAIEKRLDNVLLHLTTEN
jgi:HK97 family phage prohead protease